VQSVIIAKIRIIHVAQGAHDFTIFQVFRSKKGAIEALRKLARYEILLKNLVGN